MRFAILGVSAGLILGAILAVASWFGSAPAPAQPLPAQYRQAEQPPEPYKPIPCPVTPNLPAAEVVFEPIPVLPESFEDEPYGEAPSAFEESDLIPLDRAASAVRQGSAARPEPFTSRMPYADEPTSEFAILLNRAAELRARHREVSFEEPASPRSAPSECPHLQRTRR